MRPSYFVFVSLTTPTLALPAPGPIRTPGCPLSSERGGYSRVVARIWSDSTSAEIQDLPSFIDDFLVPEFVGADDTSNYPGPDEGTSLPVIGILGTSKQQFTDAIMEYRTKLFAVTGPIERTTINYGQGPSGICTEVQSLFNMTATLQVDYGYVFFRFRTCNCLKGVVSVNNSKKWKSPGYYNLVAAHGSIQSY